MSLYTNFIGIGYEGRSQEELIHELHLNQVQLVVDVRLNPISRKKGLSKTALTQALADSGIDYVHLRELGNPKDNREGFWLPGTAAEAESHERFRALLQSEESVEAIAELVRIGEERKVALLCFERDESRCHRMLVLEHIRSLALQAV